MVASWGTASLRGPWPWFGVALTEDLIFLAHPKSAVEGRRTSSRRASGPVAAGGWGRGPAAFRRPTDVGWSAGQCVTSPVPPQPGSDERGRDEEQREERDEGEVVDRDCGQVRER